MENELVLIYSGTTINANFYQEILSEENIESLIKNTREEAVHAGLGVPFADECDLYVYENDAQAARTLIEKVDNSAKE